MALPRMAVSGHSVTQVMQPTHLSATSSGISGERYEKSRSAAVPGGIRLRATPTSAGSSCDPVPFS